MESDAGDAYPHNLIARCENNKPGYNIRMVCYSIEKKENTDRSNLIDIRVFKPTTGNATK